VDTSNPNNYLGPGERDQLETDFAAWREAHGDDYSNLDLTGAEDVWKWAAINYRAGIRPNGFPEWIKVEVR
jgi:hypothetical protein